MQIVRILPWGFWQLEPWRCVQYRLPGEAQAFCYDIHVHSPEIVESGKHATLKRLLSEIDKAISPKTVIENPKYKFTWEGSKS
jgi:hypothetical protein